MAQAKSKPDRSTTVDLAIPPVVRTRALSPDPFKGLKGHAYIKARNLAQPVQRVQTSAHTELAQRKEVCK
jgi:hypothetical protein